MKEADFDRVIDTLVCSRELITRLAGNLQIAEKCVPDERREEYKAAITSVDEYSVIDTLSGLCWLIDQVENKKIR